MAKKREVHFNIEEKTDMICSRLGVDSFARCNARKIAEIIDCFTFEQLDELVGAIKVIAKGND
jgi:hypothetical protein